MQSKYYKTWRNTPMDVREKVMNVISKNKINFDENIIHGVIVDFWDYYGEINNGRMVDSGKTLVNTYRVPDIDNSRIFITYMRGRSSIVIDIYNRDVNESMTQSILIEGGILS